MDLAAVPYFAWFVGCYRDWRSAAGRFALDKAESFGQLRRDQVAERYVVYEHEQFDMFRSFFGAHCHRYIIRDRGDFGFKVDSPRFVRHENGITGAEKRVGAALVHKRIGAKFRRHLRAARLARQLHMRKIGAAVQPLMGAGKRGGKRTRLQWESIRLGPLVENFVNRLQ